MTILAGRYELAESVGSGGMARVYAAYDSLLDRRVAIKVISEAGRADPVARERLIREARAAAGLHHPNTVAVFDVAADADQPYIVMELISGQSLAERLRAEGKLAVDEVVEIGDAVLAGLSAAHQRGLVHRDVKPSNILLADDGAVKVADFGIAMALADSATRLTGTGQLIGTPRYLAPECVAGQQATPASDLYSLGAVLYECLSGQAPFDAPTPVAVALAHQREPVPRLADIAPEVPQELADVVEQALAKSPGDRFADADGMRRALHSLDGAVTARLPVQTQAMPTPGQDLDPSRSHPPRWVWAAGLAVAAAVAIAVLLAQLLQTGDDPDDTASPGGDVGEQVDDDPGADDSGADADDADDAGNHADDVEPSTSDRLDALAGLIGEVAANRHSAGERADDLLDDLRDLHDDFTLEDARDQIRDVGKWMIEGELDREFGESVIATLEADVSRPDDEAFAGVSQVFASLAHTWPQWGENADTLLDELEDLLNEKPDKVPEDAAKLDDKVREWMEKDEINQDVGTFARAVLEPLLDMQG